jgi:cytidylate kinase
MVAERRGRDCQTLSRYSMKNPEVDEAVDKFSAWYGKAEIVIALGFQLSGAVFRGESTCTAAQGILIVLIRLTTTN